MDEYKMAKTYSGMNEVDLEIKFTIIGQQVSLPRSFYEDRSISLYDFSYEKNILRAIEEEQERKRKVEAERDERRIIRDQVRKIEKEERNKREEEENKLHIIAEQKKRKDDEERFALEKLQREEEEKFSREEENRRKLQQIQKEQHLEYIASNYEFSDAQEHEVFKQFIGMGYNPETVHAVLLMFGYSEHQKVLDTIPTYEAIKEFGFTNIQIQYALKKFNKQEETISFLTEYQALIERGIQDSEEALDSWSYYKDVVKASKYLEEFQVLSELGYPSDQVRTALRNNQNDRNKAIQQLLGEN